MNKKIIGKLIIDEWELYNAVYAFLQLRALQTKTPMKHDDLTKLTGIIYPNVSEDVRDERQREYIKKTFD